MTILELLQYSKINLSYFEIDNFAFESFMLLEYLLGITKQQIIMEPNTQCIEEQVQIVQDAVAKRQKGYPLQYIIGSWEFYGYQFKVGDGVLIPRSDTEVLIDTVLKVIDTQKKVVIADLCSGSGCIGITLAKLLPNSQVHILEYSEKALKYIHENIELNEAKNITVHHMDVLDKSNVDKFGDNSIDILVSNPPYLDTTDMENLQTEVKHEPQMALFGGEDGMEFYEKIPYLWKDKISGSIFFEVGIGQSKAVGDILSTNGFTNIFMEKDLSLIDRVVWAQKQMSN